MNFKTPTTCLIKLFVIIVTCCNLTLYAQVNYNFEDETIPKNLQIIDSSFIIDLNFSYTLRHNSKKLNGFAAFYEKNSSINAGLNDIEWSFNVEHNANASINNKWLFWLMTDSVPNGQKLINGYALGVNFNERSDTFKLWKVVNNIATVLSAVNALSDSGKQYFFNIKRTSEGSWSIAYKTNGNNFSEPKLAVDYSLLKFSYWGFNYFYTKSYAGKIYVDDIQIQAKPAVNKSKLKVLQVTPINTNTLQVKFSEPYWYEALQDTDFTIAEIGHSNKIEQVDASTINLYFNTNQDKSHNYKLITANIADLAGNFIAPDTFAFNWHYVQPGSIVISEIMFDPNSEGDLPPHEYVELFNSSGFDINLKNWQLFIGSKNYVFTNCIFKADSFLIICNSKAGGEFLKYGNYYNLPTTGSFLSNEGSNFRLIDSISNTIFYAQYNGNQVYNNGYPNGGVSLENTCLTCGCPANSEWKLCNNINGGTPSQPNSWPNNCEHPTLKIESTQLITDSIVIVTFNKALNSEDATISTVWLNNLQLKWTYNATMPHVIEIEIVNKLEPGAQYNLKFSNFSDCEGGIMPETTIPLALPDQINKSDVLINEVLFDVDDKNSEFIEVYNASNKVIDAGNISIKVTNPLNPLFTKQCSLAPMGTLFYPHSFMVATRNPQKLIAWYNPPQTDSIKMRNLPILTNQGSLIELYCNATNLLIDSFTYSAQLHSLLLHTTQNVSLERTSLNSQWASAAEMVNYATPGYENSQRINTINTNEYDINLVSDIVSPNADGVNDKLEIQYKFKDPNWVASLFIYTLNGILVYQPYKNTLLSTQGVISWDMQQSNTSINDGIYIAFLNAFNGNGKSMSKKMTFVLGK